MGMQLCVSPNSSEKYATIMHTVGRTGVVTGVDIDSLRVQLRFINPETASKLYFWFYFYDLEKPERMFQDPCMDLVSSKLKPKSLASSALGISEWLMRLKHELVVVSDALLILQIRRCVLSLISNWTELDLSLLGGPKYVIELLKLASAEHLSSKAKNTAISGSYTDEIDILNSFKTKLSKLLHTEENKLSVAELPPLDLPCYNEKGQKSKNQDKLTSSSGVVSSITKLITEECILHFIQVTTLYSSK